MAEGDDETGLVQYDNMIVAIANAERADEAKDIKDRAQALQVYFRQKNNYDAERQCARIRVRAQRRYGELTEGKKATGTRGQLKGRDSGGPRMRPPDEQPKTLKEQGMTKRESAEASALASIPEEEFEAELAAHDAAGKVPTAGSILANVKGRQETRRQYETDPRIHALNALLDGLVHTDLRVVGIASRDMIEKKAMLDRLWKAKGAVNSMIEEIQR